MADKYISQLTAASALNDTDMFEIETAGAASLRLTGAQIKAGILATALLAANNLSEVDPAAARSNLGLGSAAIHPATDFLASATLVGGPLAVTPATVDTVDGSVSGGVIWLISMVKAGVRYGTMVRAEATASEVDYIKTGTVLVPGNGTFDFTIDVQRSGTNILLVITPASSGWSYRLQRIVIPA
ncbi:MAG: hypothetical protein WC869_00810 [Phycisphaerae bacterium]|jgi:hypothetical protein